MILQVPERRVNFPRRPLLMGIVNINDDSFSGDGTLDPVEALDQARSQIREGADIIDIGAESARTNREAISVEEEVRRLKSFLLHWPKVRDETARADDEQLSPTLLSVNTWRPEVVEQIIGENVDLLNDMSALPDDRNARLCAENGVAKPLASRTSKSSSIPVSISRNKRTTTSSCCVSLRRSLPSAAPSFCRSHAKP